MLQSKPLFMYPPVWLAVCLVAQWALDRYYPIMDLWSGEWTLWVGGAIIGASVLKVVWIKFQFGRAETSIIPYKEPEALLDTGFFAYSRNPIYVAMVFVLLGAGVIWGSASPFMMAFVFPVIITYRFIHAEEHMLEEHFGERYRAYKERVRRWL